MKLKGKAKEDFKKYFISEFSPEAYNDFINWNILYQWGMFQKFFLERDAPCLLCLTRDIMEGKIKIEYAMKNGIEIAIDIYNRQKLWK